jgi:putative Mn2+ efflux pump MntP
MWVKLTLLVVSLGFDTFAVAVALGIAGVDRRNRERAALAFSSVEGVMPLVGFFAGRALAHAASNLASVLGTCVLIGVGGWMVAESWRDEEGSALQIAGWRALAVTSLAVSMDELAVGFGMGTLGLPIGPAVALIALQAFGLTLLGTAIGRRVGEKFAERAETAAGVVLIVLGAVLFIERLHG